MASPPRYGPHIELFPAPELGNTTFLLADPDAGAAAVIDPMRDVGQYLDRAEHLGVRITHAFETHVHNDFVSGARELQAEVGARICAGRGSDLEFDHDALSEGGEIHVGRWRVRALKTPGHTPAHVSYVVLGPSSPPRALFSGGALMVGGMARTDLFGPHLAAHLAFEAFRTLQVRLRRLPDDVAVYPTHGGGSFCGVSGSDERVTTMGRERATNPYLLTTDLMAFIARALHQGPYPIYYRDMMALNQRGAPLLGRWPAPASSLSPAAVEDLQRRGAAVVDVRPALAFDRGHVPGSYSVPLDGSFSAWVGWVVERGRPIVLVDGEGRECREARQQLLRIGFDTVSGTLEGGVDAWAASGRPLTAFETAEIAELASWILSNEQVTVVDVRNEDEWVHGHVPGAIRIPVPEIPHRAAEIPRDVPVAVHCGSGYRASIAASLLEQAGLHRVIRVGGHFADWGHLHIPETIPG